MFIRVAPVAALPDSSFFNHNMRLKCNGLNEMCMDPATETDRGAAEHEQLTNCTVGGPKKWHSWSHTSVRNRHSTIFCENPLTSDLKCTLLGTYILQDIHGPKHVSRNIRSSHLRVRSPSHAGESLGIQRTVLVFSIQRSCARHTESR